MKRFESALDALKSMKADFNDLHQCNKAGGPESKKANADKELENARSIVATYKSKISQIIRIAGFK